MTKPLTKLRERIYNRSPRKIEYKTIGFKIGVSRGENTWKRSEVKANVAIKEH